MIALIAFAGCKCGNEPPRDRVSDPGGHQREAATKVEVPDNSQIPLAAKEFFRLDVAAGQAPCRVDAPCEAKLILTALGDYHVNEQYPFKWVDATADVKVDGGSFSPKGKTGTLALPFRATKAGTAKLAGTFKLSVCNDDNCQIESPKIAFDVAVR